MSGNLADALLSARFPRVLWHMYQIHFFLRFWKNFQQFIRCAKLSVPSYTKHLPISVNVAEVQRVKSKAKAFVSESFGKYFGTVNWFLFPHARCNWHVDARRDCLHDIVNRIVNEYFIISVINFEQYLWTYMRKSMINFTPNKNWVNYLFASRR